MAGSASARYRIMTLPPAYILIWVCFCAKVVFRSPRRIMANYIFSVVIYSARNGEVNFTRYRVRVVNTVPIFFLPPDLSGSFFY